jgi:hypothetical protein
MIEFLSVEICKIFSSNLGGLGVSKDVLDSENIFFSSCFPS